MDALDTVRRHSADGEHGNAQGSGDAGQRLYAGRFDVRVAGAVPDGSEDDEVRALVLGLLGPVDRVHRAADEAAHHEPARELDPDVALGQVHPGCAGCDGDVAARADEHRHGRSGDEAHRLALQLTRARVGSPELEDGCSWRRTQARFGARHDRHRRGQG